MNNDCLNYTLHDKQALDQFIDLVTHGDPIAVSMIKPAFCFRCLSRHEVLLMQNDVCNHFYFVASGALRLYFLSAKGQAKTTLISTENMIITSLSSFISGNKSFELIDALEESRVWIMKRADFFSLVENCRAWELFYRKIIETAYLSRVKNMEMRVTLSAQERYALLLDENPNLSQRVSNQVLASCLDVSQETLSRIKSKIKLKH